MDFDAPSGASTGTGQASAAVALQFRRHMKLGLRVGLKVFKGIERRQKPDAVIPQLNESLLLHLMQRARCGRPVASNETAELLMGELHFVELAPFARRQLAQVQQDHRYAVGKQGLRDCFCLGI